MDNMIILGAGASFLSPDDALNSGYPDFDMQTTLLPARLRRRTSKATRLAFAAAERACQQAGIAPAELPVIFCSSLGEIAVTDRLCSDIAAERLPLSPTLFHNSVHNTASGYWSIAVGNRHPAMAMGAGHDGFALSLVEAWSQLNTVTERLLLVCYEESLPDTMLADNHWIGAAFAFVISTPAAATEEPLASITPPAQQWPEVSRPIPYGKQSPAMAALPLFDAISQQHNGIIPLTPEGDINWFTNLVLHV